MIMIQLCRTSLNQTKYLELFVNDMLDLRQIRAGAFDFVKMPFDVMACVKDVCSIFKLQTAAKKIRVSYR